MFWKTELHQCHFCNLVGKHAIKSKNNLCCLSDSSAGKKQPKKNPWIEKYFYNHYKKRKQKIHGSVYDLV